MIFARNLIMSVVLDVKDHAIYHYSCWASYIGQNSTLSSLCAINYFDIFSSFFVALLWIVVRFFPTRWHYYSGYKTNGKPRSMERTKSGGRRAMSGVVRPIWTGWGVRRLGEGDVVDLVSGCGTRSTRPCVFPPTPGVHDKPSKLHAHVVSAPWNSTR